RVGLVRGCDLKRAILLELLDHVVGHEHFDPRFKRLVLESRHGDRFHPLHESGSNRAEVVAGAAAEDQQRGEKGNAKFHCISGSRVREIRGKTRKRKHFSAACITDRTTASAAGSSRLFARLPAEQAKKK